MSWVPFFEFFAVVGVYGFLYWLMNGIVSEVLSLALEGDALTFMLMAWHATPIFVLLAGGIWLLTVMQKRTPMGGNL
jgi:hypothetical protein